MFLFIFESIGTSELILIGIVALIFLGPRKLPQIAKTIGKTMAEFRNATTEFKHTWEREVNFEEEANAIRTGELTEQAQAAIPRENSISGPKETHELAAPQIREVDKDRFSQLIPDEAFAEPKPAAEPASDASDKRNWL